MISWVSRFIHYLTGASNEKEHSNPIPPEKIKKTFFDCFKIPKMDLWNFTNEAGSNSNIIGKIYNSVKFFFDFTPSKIDIYNSFLSPKKTYEYKENIFFTPSTFLRSLEGVTVKIENIELKNSVSNNELDRIYKVFEQKGIFRKGTNAVLVLMQHESFADASIELHKKFKDHSIENEAGSTSFVAKFESNDTLTITLNTTFVIKHELEEIGSQRFTRTIKIPIVALQQMNMTLSKSRNTFYFSLNNPSFTIKTSNFWSKFVKKSKNT